MATDAVSGGVGRGRRAGRWPRAIGGVVALALALLATPSATYAAIFDDGNDRKLLFDLRLKPESRLTDEERMILRAADRYGNVGFCGKSGGNATLIDYFGRPAIVTSAHMFYDPKTGKQRCSDAELRSATYMPNVTYFDARGSHPKTFTHRRVKIVLPEANAGLQRKKLGAAGFRPEDDFVIFYLEEDIRDDVMPGGHRRGAMTPSVGKGSAMGSGQMTMIGMAPDIRGGLATLYQTCRYKGIKFVGLNHDCDTVAGSSGSALMVASGDDGFILRGVHAGSIHGNAVIAAADDFLEWNYATDFTGNRHFDDMLAHADRPSAAPSLSPALIPYQLQFLLHRAGDYTGRLDNKWGPGSRKALDAFAARTGACLPGREPTPELWDALEAAVKEPKVGCAPSPQVAAADGAVPEAEDGAVPEATAADSGVEALGAMLDAICVAGRLDPRTMGARLESWTRDNAFEIVEHQPQKDISREESWQMRKDGRLFAAAFMHAAGEGEPGSACRVIGFDVDPAGMRDHIAARYGLPQARESEDAALLAAWAGEMEGYAGAMTIEIRKTGPVVDVWFRQ